MVHVESIDGGRIRIAKLARPEKRNALSRELVSQLTAIICDLSNDSKCRVIILTGEGSTFSAGADLKALEEMQSASFEENRSDSSELAGLFLAIRGCTKPVIARVNGHAIAGGLGLVSACDFSICDAKARLGFTEVRIGMVPAIVMALLKYRLNDLQIRSLLLRGHLISAQEAMDINLVNECVRSDDLDTRVLSLAREIVSWTSPQAIMTTKRMLAEMDDMSLSEAISYAIDENARARESSDCRAGISAFLNKMDPPWRKDES